MKKIYFLLFTVFLGTVAFGQTIFQSNLSSWAAGDPTDWMNTPRTSITSSNVVEATFGATYGTSMASLMNTNTTSHRRFVTDAITVTAGETYKIEIWLICQDSGEIRTGWYDVTNSQYNPAYNSYIDAAATSNGSLVMVSQNVTVPATCTSAEFILSLKSTSVTQSALNIGILIDSVAISVTTPTAPTVKSIYEIQYTTAPSGDSPELGNVVTTRGTVTGIMQFGAAQYSFFIQDSARAWNGVYVYHTNDSTLVIGDSVEVTGTVDEFNGLTEIKTVTALNKLGTGTIPTPVANTTLSGNMEEWEGVLINVTNAQCTSNSVGFGMWELNDGSGVLLADDDIYPYAATAVVGTNYDVVGIGHYSFGDYKILPRDINDITTSTSIDEFAINKNNVYPNPTNGGLNFNLDVTNASINIVDITGKTIKTVNTTTNNTYVNLSEFSNGLYFYNVIVNGETIQTDRFIMAK